MKAAGKTFEPVTYDGAGHGFMRAGEAPDGNEGNRQPALKPGRDGRKSWGAVNISEQPAPPGVLWRLGRSRPSGLFPGAHIPERWLQDGLRRPSIYFMRITRCFRSFRCIRRRFDRREATRSGSGCSC